MHRIVTRALACAVALVAAVPPTAALAAHHPPTGGGSLVALAHAHRDGHGPILHRGMHGRAVRALQRALTRAGYPTTANGQFGRHTEAHLRAFERAHRMRPRGALTRHAWRLLRHAGNSPLAEAPEQPAMIASDGALSLPAGLPPAVESIAAAANRIIDHPYSYGGGHGAFRSHGYDCSGAVSYALHGAGLLSVPENSTALESFGSLGPGRWVSIYADAGHAFLVVAGRAFDTADFGGPNIPSGSGPRWRSSALGNLSDHGGYVVRHPAWL